VADPALVPGQYSIGTPGSSAAYIYGAGAGGHYVQNTATDTGSLATQDQAVVGHDGMIFGIDTLPGMVVTQTGFVSLPGHGQAAMDAYGALSGKWNDPSVRLVPNAVQVLRAYYPVAAAVRRCWGRGRKIVPTYGLASQGVVPWTAQFQAADNTWYSDTPVSVVLSTVPSFWGGMTFPVTPPFQWSYQNSQQNSTAQNTGPMPTWPVITFTGPVTNPTLSYVSTPVTIGYRGVLPAAVQLVIDTRPWARTALLGGASVAGALTGVPMISMQLQPGATLLRLGGQDPTGTSTCVVTWYNAMLSIGGTT
jgi:hypothetical protein